MTHPSFRCERRPLDGRGLGLTGHHSLETEVRRVEVAL